MKYTKIENLGTNLSRKLRENAYKIASQDKVVVTYTKENNIVTLSFSMRKKQISIKKMIESPTGNILSQDNFNVSISEFNEKFEEELAKQKEKAFEEEIARQKKEALEKAS